MALRFRITDNTVGATTLQVDIMSTQTGSVEKLVLGRIFAAKLVPAGTLLDGIMTGHPILVMEEIPDRNIEQVMKELERTYTDLIAAEKRNTPIYRLEAEVAYLTKVFAQTKAALKSLATSFEVTARDRFKTCHQPFEASFAQYDLQGYQALVEALKALALPEPLPFYRVKSAEHQP